MTKHRTGDKPLSEPMIVYIADAYMRHFASMSLSLFNGAISLEPMYAI